MNGTSGRAEPGVAVSRPESGEGSQNGARGYKQSKMLQHWLGETSKEAPWSPLGRSSSG